MLLAEKRRVYHCGRSRTQGAGRSRSRERKPAQREKDEQNHLRCTCCAGGSFGPVLKVYQAFLLLLQLLPLLLLLFVPFFFFFFIFFFFFFFFFFFSLYCSSSLVRFSVVMACSRSRASIRFHFGNVLVLLPLGNT